MTVTLDLYTVSLNSVFAVDLNNLTATQKEINLPKIFSVNEFDLVLEDCNFNYCYIAAFNRFYFCDVTSQQNGTYTIKFTCDVLSTFKKNIFSNFVCLSEKILNGNYVVIQMSSWLQKTTNGLDVTYYHTSDIADEPNLTRADVNAIKDRLSNDIIFFNWSPD